MGVRGGLLKRSSTTDCIIFLASFACINASSSIFAIRARNSFLFAAFTDFLQFRRDDELAIDANVEARVAGVVEFVGDECAGVVAGCEAGFAATALGVAVV
jgi:hypothetical protein